MMFVLELMKNPHSNVIKRGLRRKLNLLEDSDFGIIDKKEINKMAENYKNNKKNGNKNSNNRKSNKVKTYGSDKESKIVAPEMCGSILEYQIGRTLAEELLKGNKSKDPQEILCDYVNTQCGLKGYCVKVIVDAN